jgi:hypothetical protein
MIDANSQFFAILTNVGMAKQANADALGIPWLITQMGVGDANPNGLADPPNPVPTAGQTKLINEWRRKPLNQLKIDPVNSAVIIAEQIIPADEGGKWIREIGLYDADGDLVAVANCAPSFKPLLSQGSGRTQIVRMNFIVTSTGNIQLKIDPALVLASRAYVDAAILEVLPKNKVPGEYTRVKVNDRGLVVSGDSPDTLAKMGIANAYTKTEIDSMINPLAARTGRLIGRQVIKATGQYVPTPGMKFVRVRVIGGGGGSSGTPPTGSASNSASGGGASGSWAEGWFTADEIGAGVPVTIGDGGAGGAAGAAGQPGGMTSVGALMGCPGGGASPLPNTAATSTSALWGAGVPGPVAYGGNVINSAGMCGEGGMSVINSVLPGVGGSSPFGSGGHASNSAQPGSGFGAGASGVHAAVNAAAKPGAAGSKGVAIFEEYA